MSAKTKTTADKWAEILGGLSERRWIGLKNSWLGQLTPSSVDLSPKVFLSEHVVDEGIITQLPGKETVWREETPRGSIPNIIFSEGLRWMDKALHVLGGAELHLERGLKSWSLSSAYQAAYFSQRAITSFLGVSIFEIGKISFVVDVCRDSQGMTPQKLEREGSFSENAVIYSLGDQLDQKHAWDLFQRILTVSRCDLWSAGWKNHLKNAQTKHITGCRHELHYKVPFWPWDDLFNYDVSPLWEEVTDLDSANPNFDASLPEYTYALTFALVSMSMRLFLSMSASTRLLEERTTTLKELLADRHPVFADDLGRLFEGRAA